MKIFLAAVLFVLFWSCKPKDTENKEVVTPPVDTTAATTDQEIPGLKNLWNTDQMLTTSESVLYNPAGNFLYVSCINGVPLDKKDNDGFIAKISMDGRIIKQKWATGLSGPKGMGLAGNLLYVTDIDRLVAIDTSTGKIANKWTVKGAKFLNDVAIASDGTVYFSDSGTSSIHTLRGGTTVETMIDADATLGGVNGLYVDGNSLMLAGMNSGEVMRMDLISHDVQKVGTGIGAGDGLQKYKSGWLVSDWNGAVHYIASDGAITEILNSKEAKLNAADIKVIEEKDLLLIPTFFGNTVAAYQLTKQ